MDDSKEMYYREVYLNQLSTNYWREITINTGAAPSTLQDIKLPDSVGGIVYRDQTNPLTRNRFIYWRSRHDLLELVEQSLDAALQGNCLRLRFEDTPVLEGVTITEESHALHLLVATVASVHHIWFQHPVSMHNQNRLVGEHKWTSVFHDVTLQTLRESGNFHAINTSMSLPAGQSLAHVSSSLLISESQSIFALGYNSSSILLVMLDSQAPADTRVLQIAASRFWSKVTRLISSSKGGEGEIPVSLAFHQFHPEGPVFIVCLCCDHRLRMWNAISGEFILSSDVVELSVDTYTPLQFGGQRHMMRKMSGLQDGYPLFLATYLCFADRRQVCIVQIKEESDGRFAFSHYSTLSIPEYDVLDLRLTTSTLWVLSLNSEGETCVQHTDLGNTEFYQAALETPPAEELIVVPELQDPREVALATIFNGVFSAATILKAIHIFRHNPDITSSSISVKFLKEEACKAMDLEIQSKVGEGYLSVEEYLDYVLDCWASFYRGCVQYQRIETCPVGLVVDEESGLAAVIRKQTLSFLRPMDVIETFQYVSDPRTETLQYLPPFSEEPRSLSDVCHLLETVKEVNRYVSEEDIALMNTWMFELKSPEIIGQTIVANMVNGATQNASRDAEEKNVLQELSNCLGRIRDVTNAVNLLLVYLELTVPEEHPTLEVDQEPLSENLFAGSSGASFLATSIQQIAEERFEVCRDLLLLELLISKFRNHLGITNEASDQITHKLQSRTVLTLQGYFALVWLTRAPVYSTIGDLGLNSLSLQSGDNSSCPRRLVECFISSRAGASKRAEWTSQSKLPLHTDQMWKGVLCPLLQFTMHLLWPMNKDCRLLDYMVSAGHYLQLQQYARLLSKWCEWNSAARQYLVGMSLLYSGEAEKAFSWLIRAGKQLNKDEPYMLERVIQPDPADLGRIATVYHLRLAPVLEHHGQNQLVVELCDTAIADAAEDDPALHNLILIKLKACLNLNRWIDAYSVLEKMEDATLRMDGLRRLLVGLCEKKQFRTLVNLPFKADNNTTLEDAEMILENLARSGDLLTHQYYDLLYSFHIHRGNFRKASSIMYEYASRIAVETFGEEGLQKQVNCYLAALTALWLVSPKYQWLVKPLVGNDPEPKSSQHQKSPKRNSEGEELLEAPWRDVEVVEIQEIKKEYHMARALLKLTQSHRSNYEYLGEVLSATAVVELLSRSGFYDLAIGICKDHSLSYSHVLEYLACRYAIMNHKAAIGELNTESFDWMSNNDFKNIGESDPITMTLRYLMHMLSLEKPGCSDLHRAVTVKLLQISVPLPTQLLSSYKKRDWNELLRVYYKFGMILDASALIVEYVNTVLGLGPRDPTDFSLKKTYTLHATNGVAQVILPYTYIDNVYLALEKHAGDHPEYAQALEDLSKKMKQYLDEAEKVSNTIMELKAT